MMVIQADTGAVQGSWNNKSTRKTMFQKIKNSQQAITKLSSTPPKGKKSRL